MSVLTDSEILSRVHVSPPLIEDFQEKCLNTTSYDLRLGDEYLLAGRYEKLDPRTAPYLEIPAHDTVIVCTREKVNIPENLIGRFGMRFGFAMRGLVLNNGPQIAPGYKGRLFCLLYNLTDKPVVLVCNKPFASIEFETTSGPARSYEGAFQGAEHISDVAKDILPQSGLKELFDQFQDMEKRYTKKIDNFYTQFITIITIVIAILGLLAGKLLLGI